MRDPQPTLPIGPAVGALIGFGAAAHLHFMKAATAQQNVRPAQDRFFAGDAYSKRSPPARLDSYARRENMNDYEKRLIELGITLPDVPVPHANYLPAKQVGNLVYTAGQPSHGSNGKLGGDVSSSSRPGNEWAVRPRPSFGR